jgi:hypothetical protein
MQYHRVDVKGLPPFLSVFDTHKVCSPHGPHLSLIPGFLEVIDEEV